MLSRAAVHEKPIHNCYSIMHSTCCQGCQGGGIYGVLALRGWALPMSHSVNSAIQEVNKSIISQELGSLNSQPVWTHTQEEQGVQKGKASCPRYSQLAESLIPNAASSIPDCTQHYTDNTHIHSYCERTSSHQNQLQWSCSSLVKEDVSGSLKEMKS